ncbi:MAG: D-glycero-beta-D-manno-heptose-7-phosphate kinase [Acidobacteria bacterium]|nr:MAG: D-glycero-beta-D-manno-heptose-7-phosphate kinase [Acidobacteriota bacterium]
MMLPSLDPDRARDLVGRFAGLASNVAHNIVALGGRAALVGLVGADAAAERLRDQLQIAGIGIDGLVEDRDRPTTEKVRIVTERNQQVARIDYERDADATGDLVRAIVARVKRLGSGAKALLVSDYLKGTVTRPIVEAMVALKTAHRALVIDPKIPHLRCYAGASLVTPNHHEAEIATHLRVRTDEDARRAARDFRERAQCDAVLITRSGQGMWLSEARAEGSIPAVAREVSDVTGAGDTVVATLSLALAAGATMTEAAALANHAAGVVVGKFGPATVTPDELIAQF